MHFKTIFFLSCGAFLPVSYMRAKKFRPKGEARRPKVGWLGASPKQSPPAVRREPQPQGESKAFGLETYKMLLRKKKPKE